MFGPVYVFLNSRPDANIMENQKTVRWKQRFINFERAFKLLERTLSIQTPSEAEKGGIIQFYEVSFELSWKIMKDYIESEGFIIKSPRQTIKQAFQMEIIENGELWLSALEDRNLTSHIYDETTTNNIIFKIRQDYFNIMSDLYSFFRTKNEQ
ncbi:MAG: nucleotidyltransferase substrate binding protein [Pseudomonadota bacterium]|nr:nucleotidyltransferase substrate binding protein [Pseudomonadota bacterium]